MKKINLIRVTFLTFSVFLLSACSTNSSHKEADTNDKCNNRAYIRMPFSNYVTSQFYSKSDKIRVGIIPFSVQENFSRINSNIPSTGSELARYAQAFFLATGKVPIVEIFHPRFWPKQRDEFFRGNAHAINLARNAGYDFAFVGYLESLESYTKVSLVGKLIDVQNGITIWYGKSELGEVEYNTRQGDVWWMFGSRRLDKIDLKKLLEDTTQCLVENALSDEPAPQ